MSEENFGITISNIDCSFFKLGKSTPDSLWGNSAQLHALAGGQTDGETLGIPAQFGETQFLYQFALRSHNGDFDAPSALKFALEHQNPLVAGRITGDKGDRVKSFSLLSVGDPNVLLGSVKPSEEGIENGLITRFWNVHSEPISTSLKLVRPIKNAWQTTHIETDLDQIKPSEDSLKLSFRQSEMKTYRLQLK